MSEGLRGYYVKSIGQNRGAPRIWLEGEQVSRAGLGPGQKFDVIVHGRTITLKACADGSRTVSAKKKGEKLRPVIDINSAELLQIFDGMDAVRMIVRDGEVIFAPLASEMRKAERLDRLKTKLKQGVPLMVGSAFHGGGVLSHAMHEGFRRAGLTTETAFINEIREELVDQSVATNNALSDNTLAVVAPAQEIVQDQWFMNELPKVDVLEMGIPCSGASVAGRAKRGLDMPESHPEVGHLVFSALVILNKTQPAAVLFENVPSYANTASAEILRYQLRDMGYVTHEAVLRGQDFGCLEHRERWCMVAVTAGVPFSFEQLVPRPHVVRTLGDVLEQVPEDDPRWSEMRGLKDKEVRDLAAGKGFRMQTFGPEDSKISTITKGYAKVRSTDPKIRHPSNPDLLRQLTPVEHARIKQVPEELIAGLPATVAHEILGQGIVYEPFAQTATHLADSLKSTVAEEAAESRRSTVIRRSGMKVG